METIGSGLGHAEASRTSSGAAVFLAAPVIHTGNFRPFQADPYLVAPLAETVAVNPVMGDVGSKTTCAGS